MFLTSPAGCCCFCSSCCDGNPPNEFDIELTFEDGECSICDDVISGIYTLTRTGGACLWEYDTGYTFISEPPDWNIKDPSQDGPPVFPVPCFYPFDSMVPISQCNPPYDETTGILRIAIQLEVYCLSETQIRFALRVKIEGVWDADNCDEYAECFLPNVNVYQFSKLYDRDGFDCSSLSLDDIPFDGASCFCWYPNAWWPASTSGPTASCSGDHANIRVCRNTAEHIAATITSVP